MKKLIISITCGALLVGFALFLNTKDSGKNIAIGGEKEPSILSISKAA
ncbi:hypothetical protein MXL46_12085 [Heyndrickxia sporothermodurans]|nr:hypothetical protein [Heyndrickxia sporothermodurans]MEB6549826.1 hypothetical protein [Heyndrickxia sporothermodurans]